MDCKYCGTSQDKSAKCIRCGAPAAEENKERKSEPFFYNGYIVYFIHDFATDLIKCQFWLGVTLIETVQITMDLLEELVPMGYDEMPVFWKLFEVAQGKEEVYKYQAMNRGVPAKFEVRLIVDEEHEAHKKYIRELLGV